jgi:hypothetical protein
VTSFYCQLSITTFPADTHRSLAQPGLSFDAYCHVLNQRTGRICAGIVGVADLSTAANARNYSRENPDLAGSAKV